MRIVSALLTMSGIFLSPPETLASAVTMETHVVTVLTQTTPWNQAIRIPKYDGDHELFEIHLTLEGASESNVDFEAISPLTIIEGNVGASIAAANIDGDGTTILVEPEDTFTPPSFSLASNSEIRNLLVKSTDMVQYIVPEEKIGYFLGEGDVVMQVSASGTQRVVTSGGNYNLSRRTSAGSTVTVDYLVVIPEPGTMKLAVVLLLTLAVIVGQSRPRRVTR